MKYNTDFFVSIINTEGMVEENEVNIRQYAKYLLKEGGVSDKRELLGNLRSGLNYKDKKITLIGE